MLRVAELSHPHRFVCWASRGLLPFPIPSQNHRLNVIFAFPCSQLGSSAGSAPSPGGAADPSSHRDPQPGQQHPISCQSLAASNGSNYSLARAIPVESLAALVLPRLFFHALISCLSDPLPAPIAPGSSSGSLGWRGFTGDGDRRGSSLCPAGPNLRLLLSHISPMEVTAVFPSVPRDPHSSNGMAQWEKHQQPEWPHHTRTQQLSQNAHSPFKIQASLGIQ